MNQAQAKYISTSTPLYRLLDDLPQLDLDELCCVSQINSKPTNWTYLRELFRQVRHQACTHFFIEPDSSLWRLRYRSIDGFSEEIVNDPEPLSRALHGLEEHLGIGNNAYSAQRKFRFIVNLDQKLTELNLRTVPTVKGDTYEFSVEHIKPAPPILEQIGMPPAQMAKVRKRLTTRPGFIVVAGPESEYLDNTLLALAQEMTAPDRKMISINQQHRFSLPRTSLLNLGNIPHNKRTGTWLDALHMHHDTTLIMGNAPMAVNEVLSNIATQTGLVIQAIPTNKIHNIVELAHAIDPGTQRLYNQVSMLITQFPVRCLCDKCKQPAQLGAQEKAWLDNVRTPATENVISWLSEGDTAQLMEAQGCQHCNDTGYNGSQSVFDIVENDITKHWFNKNTSAKGKNGLSGAEKSLQKSLMALANSGQITLDEVIRVMQLAKP